MFVVYTFYLLHSTAQRKFQMKIISIKSPYDVEDYSSVRERYMWFIYY